MMKWNISDGLKKLYQDEEKKLLKSEGHYKDGKEDGLWERDWGDGQLVWAPKLWKEEN